MACPFHSSDVHLLRDADQRQGHPIQRALGLLFGASGFVLTLAFFAFLIVFLARSRFGVADDVWLHGGWAYAANLLLVALFALQHSGMARPRFKQVLARYLPAALERTFYVHAACLAGFVLLLAWQPIPTVLWEIDDPALSTALWLAFAGGWIILLLAALSIDIFQLLGLTQAWSWYAGSPPASLALQTRGLYAWMQHPMYIGVVLGLWATPNMTVGHAYLATMLLGYILIGLRLEERDLARKYGRPYFRWRTRAVRSSGAIFSNNRTAAVRASPKP